MSTRTKRVLVNQGYRFVSELVPLARHEILHFSNIGKLGADEVQEAVRQYKSLLKDDAAPTPAASDDDSGEFVSWCFRNRTVLEHLRRGLA